MVIQGDRGDLGRGGGVAKGRPYEIMQNELDGDFTKMHVKLKFRISDVVGNDAITEFIGHDVMKDFVRRQIRRDRGKIDDTIDVVTDDGFFVRIKPFIVTRSSVKASQKSETRSVARDVVMKFCAQSTWINVQKALMDGSLEESVSAAISKIQPVRAVFFRRSQLIQEGVVVDDGPTLEEIKAEEKAAKETQESLDETQESFLTRQRPRTMMVLLILRSWMKPLRRRIHQKTLNQILNL